MIKQIAKEKLKLMGGKKIAYFGYGRYDAARNMAIDEALFLDSIKTGQYYLRFYDFDKPSVILASSDHPDSINSNSISKIGVSRRKSGGDPIYLDAVSTFSYSITGRFDTDVTFGFEFKEFVHNNLGPIIAGAIQEMVAKANVVDIGKHNSIRLNGMPIAGHAQKIEGKYAFLYQGVIAIGKWDRDKIRSVLRICDEDYESLEKLPSIEQVAKTKHLNLNDYKVEFMSAVLEEIRSTNEILSMDDSKKVEILAISNKLFDKEYSNPSWVFNNDPKLKIRSKFCLCNYEF